MATACDRDLVHNALYNSQSAHLLCTADVTPCPTMVAALPRLIIRTGLSLYRNLQHAVPCNTIRNISQRQGSIRPKSSGGSFPFPSLLFPSPSLLFPFPTPRQKFSVTSVGVIFNQWGLNLPTPPPDKSNAAQKPTSSRLSSAQHRKLKQTHENGISKSIKSQLKKNCDQRITAHHRH